MCRAATARAPMQLLPSGTQQGAVGGVLHQRVLKGVRGIRRRPAPEHQLGAYELFQSALQPRLRHLGDGTDQLVGKLTPKRGCDLRNFSSGRQSIEPGQKRGLERRWDRQRDDRPGHGVMVSGIGHPSALDDRLGQLLDEQRHTIRTINDLIGNLRGQCLASGYVRDHLGAMPRGQAAEAKQCHVRTADPGRRELRSKCENHQDPQRRGSVYQQIQRLQRGGVAPMDVFP
jgi:hypothetical protein